MPRKDPFKTLDDEPTPAAAPAAPNCGDVPAGWFDGGAISSRTISAAQIDAGTIGVMNARAGAGYWQIPSGRPGWFRRALVRLVLGWKWRKI
jgi:hypothetical protein